MKYYLLASALLLAACNAKPEEQAATDAAKPAETAAPAPAAPAAPALAGKEVSLASFGIPVVLQAPDGTTAAKGKYNGAALKGPKFAVDASTGEGTPEKGRETMKSAKEMFKAMGLTDVVVDEPMAYYAGHKGADNTYAWVLLVPDEAAKKFYILETSKDISKPSAGYTRADIDQMLAYARTAKIAK